MASIVVSGKKLEEAEAKIRDLELRLASSEKEVTMLREERTAMSGDLDKLRHENAELKKHLDDAIVYLGKADLGKAADEMVGKAKSKMSDYLRSITE